jgi:thiol-disulfide isomerase/thioredoxin
MNVKTVFVWAGFCVMSCTNHQKADTLLVKGNIENLPDGKMYLSEWGSRIDSTETKNGKFAFEMNKGDNFEPKYVEFSHVSHSDSMVRVFMFDSKAKYKSKPLNSSQLLLSEDFPELVGNFKDSDSGFGPKIKSSKFSPKEPLGRQSKVFLDDTIRFPILYTTEHLSGMLDKYPFSYHVLFQFKRLAPTLTNQQALAFLARFDSELRNGYTGKQLEKYIRTRLTRKLAGTSLPDSNNVRRTILQPEKRLHLVILWASWCGPCRREIPELKRVYQKFEKQELFDMVSISLDEKYENWEKALGYEKMPWRQLIVDEEASTYSKELFSFDGSIPTTLLVDSDGKIIKKIVGYDAGTGKELERLIASRFGVD